MLVPPPGSTLEQHMSNNSVTEAQKGHVISINPLHMLKKKEAMSCLIFYCYHFNLTMFNSNFAKTWLNPVSQPVLLFGLFQCMFVFI